MSKQYVQHVSGQGEKWSVVETVDADYYWLGTKGMICYNLPKSEYRLCEPPDERWVDVTEKCEILGDNLTYIYDILKDIRYRPDLYRLRKVKLYQTSGLDGKNCEVAAFVVEKKVCE